MKNLTLTFVGLLISLASFAQPNYGATPKDSITCIESLIYKDYLKADPKLALSLWRVAYRICPQSQKTLYINGVDMYKDLSDNEDKLAEKEKDEAKKNAHLAKKELYLDTMFSIYDRRIEMFGQKGFVLGYKGQAMLVNRQSEKEKTLEILNEAVQLTGDKTQSGTMVATMFAIINLEKEGKKTKEEVVEMFEKLSAIISSNIEKYTIEEESNKKLIETANSLDKDGNTIEHRTYSLGEGKTCIEIFINGQFDRRIDINKKPLVFKKDNYVKAQESIQSVTSPYLDCEVLVPLAEKNFEGNKDNLDWLRRTVRLLKVKKCYEAPVFAKVAEAYFKLEPSAEGAAGMGNLFLGKREFGNAAEWFLKAVDMAENDVDKAEYTFSVAQAYSYSKNYSSARTYALKAANLKGGWGEPYLLIGDCYAQSASTCDDGELGKWGVYWAAVDKYQKAKAVDGSVSSDANKKIASISSLFPETKDVFFYSKKSGDPYTVGCWINESTTIKTK